MRESVPYRVEKAVVVEGVEPGIDAVVTAAIVSAAMAIIQNIRIAVFAATSDMW